MHRLESPSSIKSSPKRKKAAGTGLEALMEKSSEEEESSSSSGMLNENTMLPRIHAFVSSDENERPLFVCGGKV